MAIELLTIKDVIQRTKLSRATIYRLIEADKFPGPIRISSNCARWRSIDIDAYCANPIEWKKAA